MAEVRVQNLNKRFGNVTALASETLTVPDTTLTVLVGPSGCGKTTLLRLVAGLEEATGGEIYVGDRQVNDVPAWDRNIAMVFQSYALYPHMTVFRNIAFPLEARKTSKAEIKTRVERTADILGISDLLERTPRQLSGGQMQRVAIGRAIVRNPQVFLMDEPLSNLDAKLRVTMRGELKRLQKELGVTTLYVTHDQAEAMTMADTLVVMRGGRIQQVGKPDEVYLKPNNVFVAGFIGSPAMNFIAGNASDGVFSSGDFVYPLPPALRAAVAGRPKPEIILGVRPEDVTVLWSAQGDALPAKVYITEPLGKENLLTLQLGRHLIKASISGRMSANIDDQVWVRFDPAALHAFDSATEAALV
jgi:multiple sugar transport system ATP-binding protein